jgi:hypothetical protein
LITTRKKEVTQINSCFLLSWAAIKNRASENSLLIQRIQRWVHRYGDCSAKLERRGKVTGAGSQALS